MGVADQLGSGVPAWSWCNTLVAGCDRAFRLGPEAPDKVRTMYDLEGYKDAVDRERKQVVRELENLQCVGCLTKPHKSPTCYQSGGTWDRVPKVLGGFRFEARGVRTCRGHAWHRRTTVVAVRSSG